MQRTKIGLLGFARSGKDTVADHLVRRGFARIAFADPVRSILMHMNPLIADDGLRLRDAVDAYGFDAAKRRFPVVRELLQGLGEGVRASLGESVWVDRAMRQLDTLSDRPVVVSDVRYRNEAIALRSRGFTLVWVQRPGVGPANSHQSEVGIPVELAHTTLRNDGSIQELHARVDALVYGE